MKKVRRTKWLLVGSTAVSLSIVSAAVTLPNNTRRESTLDVKPVTRAIEDLPPKQKADLVRSYQFTPGFIIARQDVGYKIARSLRFNAADSPSVYRTFTQNSTSTTKGILSLNVKRASLSATRRVLFYVGVDTANSNNFFFVEFNTDHTLRILFNDAATLVGTSAALYRDTTAHYHIVVSFDLSLGSNSVLVWVNGKPVALSGTLPTSTSIQTGAGCIMCIGNYSKTAAGLPFDGLISDVYWLDGQHDTNAHLLFGQFNSITNEWELKKYTDGNYGVNGGHWDFSDNSAATSSALGKDSSGNNNDLTLRNISVAAGPDNDSLTDTPTNYGTDTGVGGEVRGSYATLNPLWTIQNPTLANGNLQWTSPASTSTFGLATSTFAMESGVYFAEVTVTTVGGGMSVGIFPANVALSTGYLGQTVGYGYLSSGNKASNGQTTYGATYTTGDVIGIEFDATNGTLTFYKNGVLQGAAFTGLPAGAYYFAISDTVGGNTSTSSAYLNFGQRPWVYGTDGNGKVTTGAKALCTQNLPDPAIKNPRKYFDVLTYNGTTSFPYEINGLQFSPDLAWVKCRSTTHSNIVHDTVRGTGTGAHVLTNTTEVQGVHSLNVNLASFDDDGITIGATSGINAMAQSDHTYVGWFAKKGALQGIDIIKFTAPASTGLISVPHSLGVTPAMVIVKQTSGSALNWVIWHKKLASAANNFLSFTTSTPSSITGIFGSGHDASHLYFLVGSAMNTSADQIVYAFAEVPGFSKFDSFVGNESTDGTYVHLGFKPRWIMVKRINATASWWIYDTKRNTFNPRNSILAADQNVAESTSTYDLDVTSNGFKMRTTNTALNAGTIIYAAFADVPAKYALAA